MICIKLAFVFHLAAKLPAEASKTTGIGVVELDSGYCCRIIWPRGTGFYNQSQEDNPSSGGKHNLAAMEEEVGT